MRKVIIFTLVFFLVFLVSNEACPQEIEPGSSLFYLSVSGQCINREEKLSLTNLVTVELRSSGVRITTNRESADYIIEINVVREAYIKGSRGSDFSFDLNIGGRSSRINLDSGRSADKAIYKVYLQIIDSRTGEYCYPSVGQDRQYSQLTTSESDSSSSSIGAYGSSIDSSNRVNLGLGNIQAIAQRIAMEVSSSGLQVAIPERNYQLELLLIDNADLQVGQTRVFVRNSKVVAIGRIIALSDHLEDCPGLIKWRRAVCCVIQSTRQFRVDNISDFTYVKSQ